MMAKQRYYVVWKGRETGIFDTWAECERQVTGFTGAVYKSFPSRELAEEAFDGDSGDYLGHDYDRTPPDEKVLMAVGKPVADSIAVDAACSGNPGLLEYRGVITATGRELFREGPYEQGTVNIGEFLAIVHALAYLKDQSKTVPVYSDSATAIKWVNKKEVRTKLPRTSQNEIVFFLIERALKWLNENSYPNVILKWETKVWGEIPADFGRK
jgi:ribonuclease HI